MAHVIDAPRPTCARVAASGMTRQFGDRVNEQLSCAHTRVPLSLLVPSAHRPRTGARVVRPSHRLRTRRERGRQSRRGGTPTVAYSSLDGMDAKRRSQSKGAAGKERRRSGGSPRYFGVTDTLKNTDFHTQRQHRQPKILDKGGCSSPRTTLFELILTHQRPSRSLPRHSRRRPP